MKYIYSTLSNDQNFTVWKFMEGDKARKQLPVKEHVVLVHGKANIANKRNLITPKGVLTTVEDGDFKALEQNSAFKRFVDRGYISIESKQVDADKAATNMTKKDKSAALDEESIKKNTTAKAKTNKAK